MPEGYEAGAVGKGFNLKRFISIKKIAVYCSPLSYTEAIGDIKKCSESKNVALNVLTYATVGNSDKKAIWFYY